MKNKLKRILCGTDLITTRLILALGSLVWAVLLLMPPNLFDGRKTYELMQIIAPESIWGLMFLIQGFTSLYAVFRDINNKIILILDAMLGCLLWTSTTLLCFGAHWPMDLPFNFNTFIFHYAAPAAMSGEVVLMFASWWHLVRYWAREEFHDTYR